MISGYLLKDFKKLIKNDLEKTKKKLNEINKRMKDSENESNFSSSSLRKDFSDISEEDFILNQKKRYEMHLEDLSAALVRIESGTYGACTITGKMIQIERLKMVPHTKYSLEGLMRLPREKK